MPAGLSLSLEEARCHRLFPLRLATVVHADSAGSGELSFEGAGDGGSGEATTATSSLASNQFTSSTVTVHDFGSTGVSGFGILNEVTMAAGFLPSGFGCRTGGARTGSGLRATLMNSTGEVGTSTGASP